MGGRTSTARLEQAFFDWTKKLFQLAIVALVVLGGYLVYGLMSGGVANWSSLDAATQARITTNIQGTIAYFNLALIVLLLTSVILYYDEESLGYVLVVLALLLYFGLPFFVDTQMPGTVEAWESARNVPMLALYGEARIAALILIVPGVGLIVYDIIRRVLEGGRGDRVDLTAMKYGGGTKEIAPAGEAMIGAFAACWQLPFCRESIRVRCPIYHLRRRCWRERVGCMCEEVTIRQSLAHIFDQQPKTGNLDFATGLEGGPTITESVVPTGPKTETLRLPEVRKDQVRIPTNPNMPIAVKRERCRNCVIYNEHQRHKYQLLAPFVVAAVPALAFWKLETLLQMLRDFLQTADRVMARLSFDPNAPSVSIASATASSDIANFIMIGCLVIIATTAALRALEYVIFTLKA